MSSLGMHILRACNSDALDRCVLVRVIVMD